MTLSALGAARWLLHDVEHVVDGSVRVAILLHDGHRADGRRKAGSSTTDSMLDE